MNETPETQPLPTTQLETGQPETGQTETSQPESGGIWRRKSTLVAGGVLGAAVLLIGGFVLGGAVGDDDDDARPAAAQTQTQSTDDDEDADSDDTTASPAPAGVTVGAQDADALIAVLTAARGASEGTVTSMEANRDGSWSVDLESDAGDETTVRVEGDAASVVRTEAADADDANDPAPAGTLSDDNVASLVDAAFGEVQGTIVDIDLDDQPTEAYSVQVRAADGIETEIDLATDFSVTKSEIDRD